MISLINKWNNRFPFYHQRDSIDCGPACLQMISKYYGKIYSLEYLREKSFITRGGVSLLGLSDAAEYIGMRTLSVKTSYDKLKKEVPLPCIAHWNQNHFVVIYKIRNNKIYIADPSHGLLKFTEKEFLKGWKSKNNDDKDEGILLLLEPTPKFFQKKSEIIKAKTGFKFLYLYLIRYKKYLIQLFSGLLLGSILQLIFPFLTQSLVDFGIKNKNIGFVYLILLGEIILFISSTSVNFIRSWILLHLGTRINISIIADFLMKLMRLPISFFDTRMIGDILQRIEDHQRLEIFLTSTTLNVLFSMINLFIFNFVLILYNIRIFSIFIIGNFIYILWILVFLKKRRDIDYKRFNQLANNNNKLIQLITGMQEIKLNNCEKKKLKEWEYVQAKLFKINVKSLSLNQFQKAGALFINELKNIIVTFLAANEVIYGKMTLGMMLAIQYIIGQVNSPIDQLLGFIQTTQDAKLSLERIGEIHNKENEDCNGGNIFILPKDRNIYINNLYFQYGGPYSKFVLRNISMKIPYGKVTAIVGASGSGKTTLLKILLKFYNPIRGEIKLGNINFKNINSKLWRSKCGVVMQDGYIFSDTISNNISLIDEKIDKERLKYSVITANIRDFIESLPLKYDTKIGNDGLGLSKGQIQRILIARAIYKDPEYLFFDEATNSLDAENERIIINNLEKFFVGKTVIIIAHRLSTVKKADQIIVLNKGQIVENGKHVELIKLKGYYYNLIKNQLELDE
ncbi:peptidase domain-containing ABC transporter [Calditrichota bacterium LG25]